ncbi:MAG: Gfo/Idh/MocA family oxidoreductase [Phycisphaerales bacterium]
MAKHHVLIVGVGSIGERHARCFAQTGRAVVGIVEPNAKLRTTIAKRYGIEQAYEFLTDALDAASWSTAVICTPAQTHVALANQCLELHIPVLIEKPLAITTLDVESLITRGNPACIGVAYVYRAHPALAAMREALVGGQYGRPLQLTATCGQHFPTYRPAYASTYYARHDTGGGAIQDALTHIFNSSEWLVGPISRIAVDAQHMVLPDVQVEDTVHAIARHGEVMASYAYNQHQAPNEISINVNCEKGTVRFEMHNSRWRSQTDPQGTWEDHDVFTGSRDALFQRQADLWLNVVEGSSPPLCTLQEGIQTLAVNEAALWSVANESAWRGVRVANVAPLESIR